MISLRAAVVGLVGGALLLGGCAGSAKTDAAAEKPKPPRTAEWSDFSADSERERVFIGGQPSVAALEEFKAVGGTVVVNLRTDEEMAFLPYYGRTVEAMGLEHVRVPTGGADLGPDTHAALLEVLDRAEGPVLLHCASGGRATYLWGGHLTQADGYSAADAKLWCRDRRDGKAWEGGEAAIDRISGAAP